MQIDFYCRKSKANRNGKSPIECSIAFNGQRRFFNLEYPKQDAGTFDKARKRGELKHYLADMERHIEEAVAYITSQGQPLTFDAIKSYIKSGGVKAYTLEDAVAEYINFNKTKSITANCIRKYEVAYRSFCNFIGADTQVTAISNAMILMYYNTISKHLKVNTVAGYMTKVKTLFRFLYDNGKVKNNVASSIKIHKQNGEIEYLTEDEMQALRDADLHGIKRLENVRDLCLIQAATGLSYIDLQSVNKDSIQQRGDTYYIQGKRHKTKVSYTAVIFPEGIEVLKSRNWDMPMLTNQKYNSYLKELQDIAGISKQLHTHLFRKTYATRLINAGIRMDVVAKCMGHTNAKITASTYASIETQTIVSEVGRLLS